MGLCSTEESCPVIEATLQVKAGRLLRFKSEYKEGEDARQGMGIVVNNEWKYLYGEVLNNQYKLLIQRNVNASGNKTGMTAG